MAAVDDQFLELKASTKLTCFIGRLNEMRLKLEELISQIINETATWDIICTKVRLLYKMLDLIVGDIQKDDMINFNDFVLVPIGYVATGDTDNNLLSMTNGRMPSVDASLFPNLLRTKVEIPIPSKSDHLVIQHENIQYFIERINFINSAIDECITSLLNIELEEFTDSSIAKSKSNETSLILKESKYQKIKEITQF